jgi:hypothetical protein
LDPARVNRSTEVATKRGDGRVSFKVGCRLNTTLIQLPITSFGRRFPLSGRYFELDPGQIGHAIKQSSS